MRTLLHRTLALGVWVAIVALPPPVARGGDEGAMGPLDAAALRALRDPLADPAGVRAALARAGSLVRDRKALAATMRTAGVEVEGAVGVKAEAWGGIEAGTAVGNAGGSWSAGWRDLKWKGSAGADDRTLTSALEVTAVVHPDGSRLKRVYAVGLQYPDNRSYLEAMGLDAANIPGMPTALRLLRTALDRGDAPPPAATTAPPSVLEAVGAALRDDLPALFRAATRFSHYEVRTGWLVEDPTGKVSVSHVEVERRVSGTEPGPPVRWHETSAGVDLDVDLPVGAVRAGATGAVSVKWAPGRPDAPETSDARRLAFADAVERGDAAEVADLLHARLAPVLDGARLREALVALDRGGTAAAREVGRIIGLPAPEVGGVSLHFDPATLATGVAPEAAARLLGRMLDGLASGSEGFVVTAADGRVRVVAVGLRALLDDANARTVGPLVRLRGVVIDPAGDVVLLGETGTGPPIDLDVLAVAARAVHHDGTWPFVSLDPDPADLAGPQQVRVGGVPDALRETAFVRTMLDADYAMKRIALGIDAVDAPGFRSWHDLLAAAPHRERSAIVTRAWLVPMPSRAADVWTHTDGARRVVLFDSRVQVLSEAMKRVADLLVGTGESDPEAEEAADELTRHYDAVAQRRPIFRALAGVFDCTKLCAILAREGIAHPLLDRLASRVPRRVELPTTYEGIGPIPVAGTPILLSGGVEAEVRLRRRDVRATPALAPLLSARDGAVVHATFPTTLPLAGRDVLEERADILVHRALALLSAGRTDAAIPLLERAVADEAGGGIARVLLASARALRGDLDRALVDVEAGVAEVPHALGLRGLLRTLRGDVDRGRVDTDEALRRFPDDEATLAWASEARLFAGDFAGAEDVLAQILIRTPADAAARLQWSHLDVLHRLGPTRARERMRLYREVPYGVLERYHDGAASLLSLDPVRAVESLSQALDALRAHEAAPAVQALFLRERIEVVLASAKRAAAGFGPLPPGTDPRTPREILEAVAARHPTWTTPRLLLLAEPDVAAGTAPEGALDRVLSIRGDDPLLADFATLFGEGRTAAWAAVTIWRRVIERGAQDARLAPLLDRVAVACGDGYEASLFRAMRAVMFTHATAQEPVIARLRAMPVPLPPDPVTILAVVTTVQLVLAAPVTDEGRAARIDALRRFVVATDLEELAPALWPALSIVRLGAIVALGEQLAAAEPATARWEQTRLDLLNGRLDVAEARARVESAFAGVEQDLRRDLSALAAGLASSVHRSKVPVGLLRDAARSGARLRGDLAERDRVEAEVGTWEDEEHVAQSRLRGPDRALALFEEARRPADLHMLSSVRDLIGAIGRVAEGTPQGDALARTHAKLQARLRGSAAPVRRRDWSQWADPAPGAMVPASTNAPASKAGGEPTPIEHHPAGTASPASGGPSAVIVVLSGLALLAVGWWVVRRYSKR